jgi:hypothetical protein
VTIRIVDTECAPSSDRVTHAAVRAPTQHPTGSCHDICRPTLPQPPWSFRFPIDISEPPDPYIRRVTITAPRGVLIGLRYKKRLSMSLPAVQLRSLDNRRGGLRADLTDWVHDYAFDGTPRAPRYYLDFPYHTGLLSVIQLANVRTVVMKFSNAMPCNSALSLVLHEFRRISSCRIGSQCEQ